MFPSDQNASLNFLHTVHTAKSPHKKHSIDHYIHTLENHTRTGSLFLDTVVIVWEMSFKYLYTAKNCK